MKLFKFQQVDFITGISVLLEPPINGPTNPNIGEYNIVLVDGDWRYAYVSDSSVENPENFIFEITEQEFSVFLKNKADNLVNEWKSQLYVQEKNLRNAILKKYDDTALSSGIYKYSESKNFLDSGKNSEILNAEANVRGISVIELANKIITNHENYAINEAKISGLRGKILDRLNSYVFDLSNSLESWRELAEKTEIIGQKEIPTLGPEPLPQKDNNVKVGYYHPDLSIRWKYLNS
jgi:hypothetical protein